VTLETSTMTEWEMNDHGVISGKQLKFPPMRCLMPQRSRQTPIVIRPGCICSYYCIKIARRRCRSMNGGLALS
jgi:hypothetical protein